MKKPASSLKSPNKNATEPGSAIKLDEADATVAEPTGTNAAERQEEIVNQSAKPLALENGANEPDPQAKAKPRPRQQANERPKQRLVPRRRLH